jgi:hypothetical protein
VGPEYKRPAGRFKLSRPHCFPYRISRSPIVSVWRKVISDYRYKFTIVREYTDFISVADKPVWSLLRRLPEPKSETLIGVIMKNKLLAALLVAASTARHRSIVLVLARLRRNKAKASRRLLPSAPMPMPTHTVA